MAIVYKISNSEGEVYIGSTIRNEIATRKNEHKYSFKKKRKGLLYDSFKKYGFDNHKFDILSHCNKKDVRELEHFLIQEFNPSLNIVVNYNATALNKIWINNGIIEKQIHKHDSIPFGFLRGRKQNSKLGRPYINI